MSPAAGEILAKLVRSCARTHGKKTPVAGPGYGSPWEGGSLDFVVAVRRLELPFLRAIAEAAAEGRR